MFAVCRPAYYGGFGKRDGHRPRSARRFAVEESECLLGLQLFDANGRRRQDWAWM